MKANKGTTVLLTVIGIATLLVAVVGATFAYFSATVKQTYTDNDNQDVVVEAATVGTITFTHGYTIDLCDDKALAEGQECLIYPGAQEAKTFKVTADPSSTIPVEYTVYLKISDNTFETDNLVYKVSADTNDIVVDNKGTNSVLPTFATEYKSLSSKATDYTETITLGTAVLGTAGAEDVWTLDVKLLNDENANQVADQGKVFNAIIEVEPTNNTYSATYNANQGTN